MNRGFPPIGYLVNLCVTTRRVRTPYLAHVVRPPRGNNGGCHRSDVPIRPVSSCEQKTQVSAYRDLWHPESSIYLESGHSPTRLTEDFQSRPRRLCSLTANREPLMMHLIERQKKLRNCPSVKNGKNENINSRRALARGPLCEEWYLIGNVPRAEALRLFMNYESNEVIQKSCPSSSP